MFEEDINTQFEWTVKNIALSVCGLILGVFNQ